MPVFVQGQSTGPTINAAVSGRITDARTKEPLIGATVLLKKTRTAPADLPDRTNGGTADAKGQFLLKTGQQLPFTLVVSFISWQPREILGERSTVGRFPGPTPTVAGSAPSTSAECWKRSPGPNSKRRMGSTPTGPVCYWPGKACSTRPAPPLAGIPPGRIATYPTARRWT
ncbi:MAG: carboxypeptidase-like regulatory domain-containing protein [Bacteroidetes bacterium]|nr:carboxypeptidase-like regulatory domain-containing protein [Fibrella sp.]